MGQAPPPPPPPTNPPPPGATPPGSVPPGTPPGGTPPPYGGQPPYGGPPGYGPPGGPPRRGIPGWAIAAIVVGVLAIAGAVTAIVLLGGEDDPPGPLPTQGLETSGPTPAPTVSAVSPLPTAIESPEDTGVNCSASPPATLSDCLPLNVGNFELVSWDNAPQFASTFGAVSAIESEYLRPDNTQILHYLFSYNTNAEASVERGNYVNAFKDIGFVEVATERSRGIRVTRLAREKEVLVWSNGRIMAVVEGPFDVTTGFFAELSY